jgi:hypothetical protein
LQVLMATRTAVLFALELTRSPTLMALATFSVPFSWPVITFSAPLSLGSTCTIAFPMWLSGCVNAGIRSAGPWDLHRSPPRPKERVFWSGTLCGQLSLYGEMRCVHHAIRCMKLPNCDLLLPSLYELQLDDLFELLCDLLDVGFE